MWARFTRDMMGGLEGCDEPVRAGWQYCLAEAWRSEML